MFTYAHALNVTGLEHAQSKANLDAETQQRINDSHRMLTALFALQGETTLLDSLSTESDREHNHQQFENEVAINYGRLDTLNHPNQLRCMITNQFHPARLVCKAAHILALSEKKSMPLLGLNKCDIWDPRNGLCILRTIDRRFESKELVREICLHVTVLQTPIICIENCLVSNMQSCFVLGIGVHAHPRAPGRLPRGDPV
jgi:hypothetical protein